MHLSCPPCMLHTLPMSVFLTWSPKWYLVRSTEHKAPHYVVFSTSLWPHKVGVITTQFDCSVLLLLRALVREGILLKDPNMYGLFSVVIPHVDPADGCRTGSWNIYFNETLTQLITQAYVVLLYFCKMTSCSRQTFVCLWQTIFFVSVFLWWHHLWQGPKNLFLNCDIPHTFIFCVLFLFAEVCSIVVQWWAG
jgi:hypothetical protein